jgi:hypothetical protein
VEKADNPPRVVPIVPLSTIGSVLLNQHRPPNAQKEAARERRAREVEKPPQTSGGYAQQAWASRAYSREVVARQQRAWAAAASGPPLDDQARTRMAEKRAAERAEMEARFDRARKPRDRSG